MAPPSFLVALKYFFLSHPMKNEAAPSADATKKSDLLCVFHIPITDGLNRKCCRCGLTWVPKQADWTQHYGAYGNLA